MRVPPSPWSPTPCCVCGCPEVHTDEVAEAGLRLEECPRCKHRATRRLARPEGQGAMLRAAPRAEESAAA